MEDSMPCCYGTTLQKDSSFTIACSWASADPSTFLIRSKTYLQDRQKVLFSNLSHYYLGHPPILKKRNVLLVVL